MNEHDDKLEIFLANRAALVEYATPICGCRNRAEDVVQDAYLRFTGDTRSRARGPSAAYLHRIVRNLALDLYRRTTMESRHRDANAVTWLVPDALPDPEQQATLGNELEVVERALGELPASVRTAVRMHRLGGHTLEEIAVTLHVSPPTVHRMIRDAMVAIARRLTEAAVIGPERNR